MGEINFSVLLTKGCIINVLVQWLSVKLTIVWRVGTQYC